MMTDEQKAEAAAKQAQAMGFMAVVLSTFSGAWLADRAFGDGAFAVSKPTAPLIGGAVAGLFVGLAIRFLDREDQRRTPAPPESPPPAPGIEWLPLAMIALASVAGLLIWQRDALGLLSRTVLQLGVGTVFFTALLGYFDLRQLLLRHPEKNPNGPGNASPAVASFAMLLALWLLFFPLHFVIRRRYGGRNLIVPGLLASALFLAPAVGAWFAPPELPPGDSPDVMATVQKMFVDPAAKVTDPVEVSYDREKQRRVMKAVLATPGGGQPFYYLLTWENRDAHRFQVQAFEREP